MTTGSATAEPDQDNVEKTDVLVVGAGMAGLCAAIAARQAGASVIVLEKAPEAERGGNTRFSNGAIRAVYGAGEGASEALFRAAERSGARVFYKAKALSLIDDAGRITGVIARKIDADIAILAQRVVLACGGFEANAEWRTRYIGPSWDLAK